MAKRAFQYLWQCVDCKRCQSCQKADDQQKMLYCQQCDRAYHIYCTKSLKSIPKGEWGLFVDILRVLVSNLLSPPPLLGMWHCDICSICRKCGCRNPDGTNHKIPPPRQHPHQLVGSPHRRAVAGGGCDWKHEFVKNEATGLKEHCGMLCVRCVAASSAAASSSSS